jgi:hypothetical protein
VAFANATVTVTVTVTDLLGKVMPADTAIAFSASNGTIINSTSYPVPNTSPKGPPTYTVKMQSDATQSAAPTLACTNARRADVFTVNVTTPKGTRTSLDADVND